MNMTSVSDAPSAAVINKRRLLFSNVWCFLAFGGGAGLSPKAPGTAGTLLAFPLYYAAAAVLPLVGLVVLAVLLLAVGVPICARAGRLLRRHDDGAVVWDEIAAFFAVLVLLPAGGICLVSCVGCGEAVSH